MIMSHYRKLTKRQEAFVSRKIPILLAENYPRKQAIAIAISMSRKN